jgi:hypothetical protein
VAEKQTVIEGALEVVKDLLRSREMRLSRIMYVEAHLLNHVGDVRPGEGKVLKSPNQVMVGSRSCQRAQVCPECRLAWSRACSRSCQCAQVCPERTGISACRGHRGVAPSRCQGSGVGGQGPSWQTAAKEP